MVFFADIGIYNISWLLPSILFRYSVFDLTSFLPMIRADCNRYCLGAMCLTHKKGLIITGIVLGVLYV